MAKQPKASGYIGINAFANGSNISLSSCLPRMSGMHLDLKILLFILRKSI